MKPKKIITVFGSSRTRKNTKAYEEAYQLGKLIAEAGFVLCNGGYGGTMTASSSAIRASRIAISEPVNAHLLHVRHPG